MAELLKSEKLHDGRVRRFYREDEKLVVTSVVDAEPLLEAAKRQFNDAPERYTSEVMNKVAEFPGVVLEAAARAAGLTWREFMDRRSDRAVKAWNRLLNDPEMRAFRTRPGRVVMKQR